MPATDQYWRKLPTMHMVFAGSALLLGIATWLLLQKDEAREWRGYQVRANELRQAQIDAELERIKSDARYQAQLNAADEKVRAAEEVIAARQPEIRALQDRIRELQSEYEIATVAAKDRSAWRDFARSVFDLDVRDQRPQTLLERTLSQFDADRISAEVLALRAAEAKQKLDAARRELAELTAVRDEAVAAKRKLEEEYLRLVELREQISPSSRFVSTKRSLKELPILNAFNPHLKILYDWPSIQGVHLEQGLGMTRVNRVDRCRTCHVHINDFIGDEPRFPHADGQKADSGEGYPHPFASHPHPELYLTSGSPHPIEKFGCTICHSGDGSGTSFQNAEHTPTNPAQAKHWHEKYGWHSNHFWEDPMHPTTLTEASCIRCHHQVTELGMDFGNGPAAPKVFEGYQIVREYGCYGCHPINGFDGTKPIGPDLRLEPQTVAEALAIAEDPKQIAGDLRKVGPSLRHIGQKVTDDFISYWTEEPKRFRPDTRMPQFFHLSNQEDELAELLQPVELAGITAYLVDYSEELPLSSPADDYTPNAQRGKELFAQRGCLACHSHDDAEFEGIRQDFGPNLSKIHEKIKPGEEGFNWLYTWLRDPTLHHPRTLMPNTFLFPEQQGEETVDPAADIAAFLLEGGPREFPTAQLPGVYLGAIVEPADGGVRVVKVLPDSPAERARKLVDGPEGESGQAAALPSLMYGDVIRAVNGREVSNQEELDALISTLEKGQEVSLDLVRNGVQQVWKTRVSTPQDDLTLLYLSKALSADALTETFESRGVPVDGQAWEPLPDGSLPDMSEFIRGDEIELVKRSPDEEVSDEEWEARKLRYIGRRTISQYGCYGCHDIPGFDDARPIGTALQDWGRKDPSQLAIEHIGEYLHHHGEPDGSSTAEAVENIIHQQFFDGTATHEEKMKAFFYESLLHHGRPGFVWQKLREPRSYDYRKIETKGWDERLRMPKFPFDDKQIESVATFVVGLVADPPAEPYLYQPEGPKQTIVQGTELLEKYNCTSCHMLEMPGFKWNVDIREFVGLSRAEIVDFIRNHAGEIADEGILTQDILAGREPADAYLSSRFGPEPTAEEFPDESELAAAKAAWESQVQPEREMIAGLNEVFTNIEALLEGRVEGVESINTDVAPLLARLSRTRNAERLEQWFDAHPEALLADPIDAADYPSTVRLSLQLKPPVQRGPMITNSATRADIEFHGLQYTYDPDFGEETLDLWENLNVAGRYKLAGVNSRLIANEDNPIVERLPGKGGDFMVWLYNRIVDQRTGGEPSLAAQYMYLAQQAAPPPLYKEGVKVQTPWLYQFLKSPERLRFTTVLRMPQFNIDDDDAQILANYFAAVDGVPYPYSKEERMNPAYLAEMQRRHAEAFPDAEGDYLQQSWDVLNADKCIGCHSVGGRKYISGGTIGPDGQPLDIQGPYLKRVQDRLRSDWLQLWIQNPKWITPYTSMPANLPSNQTNLPGLFDGRGDWQNEGLVDALMNYSDLMETIGPTVYVDPSTAPMDQSATGGQASEAADSPGDENATEDASGDSASGGSN